MTTVDPTLDPTWDGYWLPRRDECVLAACRDLLGLVDRDSCITGIQIEAANRDGTTSSYGTAVDMRPAVEDRPVWSIVHAPGHQGCVVFLPDGTTCDAVGCPR